jgi:site-specific DNA-methyltransferase (adenine-specific)
MIVKEKIGGLFFDLIKGDTLIENEQIEDGSVDLILTDLPYGNMQGIDFDDMPHGKKENANQKIYWDEQLTPKKVFEICNRILRKNGKAVFTAQGEFVFELHKEQIPNLPFNHKMIWDKQQFANCLLVNKAPLNYYEDVLVFSKTHETEAIHPLRLYFKIVMDYIGLNLKQINSKLGHRRAEHTFYIDSTQYGLCTEKTYLELIDVFAIDKMDWFKEFAELKEIDNQFKNKFASTFNLWEGNKYKSNILKYKKDYSGHHPTQKPVLLLEDLIKTFSNENDLVVDLTMGSGSTGVACKNTNRNFIGIEKDDKYFDIAVSRIKGAEPKPNNFEKVEERGLFSFTDEPDKLD